jgi:hypothetical protein
MHPRMQKETIQMKVEYRVRPVTRFVVTRYHQSDDGSEVSTKGTYDNAHVAYEVAYALCKAEHDASGEPLGSMAFIYPDTPEPKVSESIG